MSLTADEAEFVLKAVMSREQQRFQQIIKPYFAELGHAIARQPPRPVTLPDGRVMQYVGPTAEDLGGPYRAPSWLEELCSEDYSLAHDLARYRERR
jgi:hypothetical protein